MATTETIVLFINAIRPATFAALDKHYEQTGQRLTPVVLVDESISESIAERNGQKAHADRVKVIRANFDDPYSVRNALRPIQDNIIAMTCQYENSIHELQKIVPYLPYLPTPSELSLEWSTEKKDMRDMIGSYNPKLVPGYMEISDYSSETLAEIKKKLSYPLVVKPSGLEGSLLVTMAQDEAELIKILPHVFAEIQKGYDTWIKRQTPVVLVEEFMAGDMYSVDVYVNSRGVCKFTPVVKVVTGRKVGFEDFFGYMQVAPSGLDDAEQRKAQEAAEQTCHALGLRSVTGHVELMQTPDGWKIIELGPRIGGYRHDIYDLAYGMNHIMNDILNRAEKEVIIPTKLLRHTAMFKLYSKDEGVLAEVNGVDSIRALESFVSVRQTVDFGTEALFAKNNGDPILEVMLSHEDEAQFNNDVAEMEKNIAFVVTPATLAKV